MQFILNLPTGSEIFDLDDGFSEEEIDLDIPNTDFIDNDTNEKVEEIKKEEMGILNNENYHKKEQDEEVEQKDENEGGQGDDEDGDTR